MTNINVRLCTQQTFQVCIRLKLFTHHLVQGDKILVSSKLLVSSTLLISSTLLVGIELLASSKQRMCEQPVLLELHQLFKQFKMC